MDSLRMKDLKKQYLSSNPQVWQTVASGPDAKRPEKEDWPKEWCDPYEAPLDLSDGVETG